MDQAHGDSLATAVNFAARGFVIIRNGDDVLPLVACQQGSFLSEVGDETPQLIVSSILRGLKPNPDFPPDTSLHLCYGQQFGFFDGYYLARVTNFNQPEGGDPYYYENNTLQGRFWNNNLKKTYYTHPLDE